MCGRRTRLTQSYRIEPFRGDICGHWEGSRVPNWRGPACELAASLSPPIDVAAFESASSVTALNRLEANS